jgi:hypothetical protein
MRNSVVAIGLLVLAAHGAHADTSAGVGFVPGDPGTRSQKLQLEVRWDASDAEIEQVKTWSPAASGSDVYQGEQVTCAIRDTTIVCDVLFDRKGAATAPDHLLVDDAVERSPDFGGSTMAAPSWKKATWSFSLADQSAILLGAWIGGAKKPLARCKLTASTGVVQSAACTFKMSKTGKLRRK